MTIAAGASATVSAVEVSVSPGSLASKISQIPASEKELVLKGSVNAADYPAFQNLPASIISVDMKGLSFLGGESPVGAKGKSVYSAGELPDYMFFSSPVVSVVLPSGILSVGEGSFAASAIKEITLPSSCRTISPYAFYGCKGLEKVNFSQGIARIGEMAFAGCEKLDNVKLPADIVVEGKETFSGSGVKVLDARQAAAYADYSLAGMPSVEQVGINPEASLGEGMLMANEKMNSVIGMGATIPALFTAASPQLDLSAEVDGMEEIGEYAFAANNSEIIMLSKDLERIDDYAFANCKNLKGVDAFSLGNYLPDLTDFSFSGIDVSKVSLYVTKESAETWQSHPVWGKFDVHPGENSITSVETDGKNSINIISRKNAIEIRCGGGVGNYAIYNIDGKLIKKGSDSSDSVTVSLPSSAGSLIAVKVWNKGGEKSATIMR